MEGSSSSDIGGSSSDIGGSSSDIGGSSSDIGGSSSDIGPTSDPVLLSIAAASRESARLKPEQTEQILLELCRMRFLTMNQIGGLLGRVPRDTRNRFLSPMVADGRLQMKYPNDPNHPQQAYQTVDKSKPKTE
jgi:hypothetical protein